MSQDKLVAVLTELLVQKGVSPAEVFAALKQGEGASLLDTVVLPTLSSEELEWMWSRWDGVSLVFGYSGEAIHTELNKRGLGHLCPV